MDDYALHCSKGLTIGLVVFIIIPFMALALYVPHWTLGAWAVGIISLSGFHAFSIWWSDLGF